MNICTLTKSAQEQIANLCKEHAVWGISLNLKGGGCAGFEYEWGMINSDQDLEKGDFVIDVDHNAHLVVSGTSLMFLAGTEVDYVKSIVGSNFEIRNPNAQSSCGCGVSVNFDMNKVESNTHAVDLAYRV
jgi:iron-sulfur cluster assembly accessory protein